ncbi:MAG TPA: hypothetical protein VIW92_12510 [Thermoanaerobaculia bacterium]
MVPSTRLVLALVLGGIVTTALAGVAQDEGLPPETLAQSTPVFAFQSQGNRPALIFTRNGTPEGYAPRVFLASRDGWRLIQLSDDLYNTNWVFAGRAMSGDTVWGVTRGSGGGLIVVSSQNGGRNWRTRGSLQAISPKAVVDLFSLNDEAKGTLILRLDEEDPDPNGPRAGYYVYLTKNGGKNWSEGIYSQGRPTPPPNLLMPPDRTFDAQQPLDLDAWQRLLAELQPAG